MGNTAAMSSKNGSNKIGYSETGPGNKIDQKNDTTRINFEQRKTLIARFPCFSSLKDKDIEELASVATEKHYTPKQIIVSQGEFIDVFYIIAKGAVEIASEIKGQNKIERIPQVILREGEGIGLSYKGFFAEEGVRTATLTAISDVTLIGWTISSFHHFIQTHPMIGDSMQQAAEQMLRMNFIKQVAPFTDLPIAKIAWLAQQVEEISVTPNTILFREGELGDQCYLIRSGRVEILIVREDGSERTLAILEPPMLFGETSLLTASPRSATAKIIEEGKLLVLRRDQFLELLEQHVNIAESIMALSIERSRPVRLSGITHYLRETEDGQTITILKNAERGSYYQLSPEGWFVWQQLDGRQTLQDITLAVFNKFNAFAPGAIAGAIFNLADAGFVSLPGMNILPTKLPEDKSRWARFKYVLDKMIYIHFAFRDIDKYLTASYKAGIHLLFTLAGKIIIGIAVIVGLIFFGLLAQQAIAILPSMSHPLLLLVCLILAHLFLSIFHELGHAYTTKAYGHEVHSAGIVFYWLGLIAYVDTSDMWLSTRGPRIIVNLAGPCTDMLLAGIVSICAWFIPQPEISEFFWLLALLLYFSVFRNLNPLRESDGYYVLSDTLNYSKLRLAAFSWLARLKLKIFFDLKFLKKHQAELLYWIICGIFLFTAILLAILIQHYLRLILPNTVLGIPTYHLSWLLPASVVASFMLSVISSLQKWGKFND